VIPKDCKRLIEVDFPVAAVSVHSAREKSIRHGHPSTLHLWWARRPLAACRAVLLGLLLPDPCDPSCPAEFKKQARGLLAPLQGKPDSTDLALRKALLRFIGDFANWDHAAEPAWLEVGRGLVKAAHPEETPLVVDPFAGGGSIPLEALRLGCEAFASDLNPVACLILKVMLEDIPKHGSKLAEELRKVGAEIKAKAEKELAEFYPRDPDGSTPIAYLWARTVTCEAPDCGAEIPLVRSFWLCKKPKRKRALRYHVVRPKGKPPRVELEIFEPKKESDVPSGTVARAKAKCLCCGAVLHPERVRAQISTQHGGANVIFDKSGNRTGGAHLLAVVTLKPNQQGRHYRLPTALDYNAVWKAAKAASKLAKQKLPSGLSAIPNEPLPWRHGHRAIGSPRVYGMLQWGDLFTARQKVALVTLARLVSESEGEASKACAHLLAVACDRVADATASISTWLASGEEVKHVFSRQALPTVWDYGETNPLSSISRSWSSALNSIWNVLTTLVNSQMQSGQAQQADATEHPLPNETAQVWFTDPPYYDAIPYADLSDFFYVWLKRTLPAHPLLRDPYDPSNLLSPKWRELTVSTVAGEHDAPKNRDDFERGMARAFTEGRRVLKDDGVGCVVFAHKTTEGWETLLSGIMQGGWSVTASWPISTEMGTRLNARDTASLAASVHLVCRPRPQNAGVGDWGEVHAEMQKRVKVWMARMLDEGIRGADAIFSCIGPALESYSRYEQVKTAADKVVPLGGDPEAEEPDKRGFLAYVFETVSREALENVLGKAETERFEEDARLTALFLWTLQSTKTNGLNGGRGKDAALAEEAEEDDEDEEKPTKAKGGFSMPFDTFIRITRPMGIHYQNWEKRVIETEKDVVRLRPVVERSEELLGTAGTGAVLEFALPRPQTELFGKGEVQRQVVAAKRGVAGRQEQFTTLDRLHQAMLLFRAGQTTLLRQMLEAERSQGRRFERLAFALTPLYPDGGEERRWLEGLQALMGLPATRQAGK
jgi:adenine-specific DNA methylase